MCGALFPTQAALSALLVQARLGAALAGGGAALTPEDWAPHVMQQLVAQGLLDSHAQQLPQLQRRVITGKALLAELSGCCDVQILSSAVLLVAQTAAEVNAAGVLTVAEQCWSELAAAAPDTASSRLCLPVQDRLQQWWQQEVPGYCVQEALQATANVAWLMHCRQQVRGNYPGKQALGTAQPVLCAVVGSKNLHPLYHGGLGIGSG